MTTQEPTDFYAYVARKFISEGLTSANEKELKEALKNTLRGSDEAINRS